MIKSITEKEFYLNKEALVLVDFYADWCGPCKMIAPILEDLSNHITDVTFQKVNVDHSANLAHKHQVLSIPTILLFKDGIEVSRKVGFVTKKALEEWIITNK